MKTIRRHHGFTLIELMLSIAILATTSALIVPLFGNNDALQIDIARRLLVSEIEYAQILAITNPEDAIVLLIDEDGKSWHIATVEEFETPLLDTVTGEPLVTTLGQGSAASAPDVIITGNMQENAIIFNSNGGLYDFTQSVEVMIRCGETESQIIISPTTGSIR